MAWKPSAKSGVNFMRKQSKQSKLRKLVQDYADWTRSFVSAREKARVAGVIRPGGAPVGSDALKKAPDGNRNEALSGYWPAARLPSFLRRGSGYKPKMNNRAKPSSISSRLVAGKNLLLLQGINLHSATKALVPTAGNRGPWVLRVAFPLLALCGIVAAPFLLSQIVAYKSENRLLQQEVSRLRENLGRLEQKVKAEKDAYENLEMTEISAGQRSVIELSKDEIQYIREYIKPAPRAASARSVITTGEVFEGATVPLPAPIMEKIPKLEGARFAIRDGAIVILKRSSDRVNAVLLPN